MGGIDVDIDVDLSVLRQRIAAMSGQAGQRDVAVSERETAVLPVPDVLADLLPHKGIARGTILSANGARSVIVALIATVSGAGGQVAVVGMPNLSMASAVEMGADLSRIALVADPGIDPVEIGAILLDGMDLVVLGLAGISVPPSRAKVLAGRARKQSSVLLVTGGRWPGAQLQLTTRVIAYRNSSRILGWRLQVSVAGRGLPQLMTDIDCGPRLTAVAPVPIPALAVAN